MSNFYEDIEFGVLNLLRLSPALATIKMWESGLRECFFTGEPFSKGFRNTELPAVLVTAMQDPTRSRPETHAEIRYIVPVQVVIVVSAERKALARDRCTAFLRAAEHAIHQGRRTTSDLGANTFILGDLVSSIVAVEQKPLQYAVASIATEVHKVVPL